MKTANSHTILPRRFIAVCTLLLAIGSSAMAQEKNDTLIPMETAPWDGISKRLDESEIVVVGLVDSVDASDPDGVSGGQLTPKKTLTQQLRKLRSLGNESIPGLDDKVPFSKKISILVVENIGKGDAEALESHQQRARAMYQMMGAHPYVMSNPVIYLVHKGKLVRGYGVKYHSPGRDGALLAELVTALLSPEKTDEPLLPEIAMMNALELREKQGNQAAIDYLKEQFIRIFDSGNYYPAYSYFWTEAQVRTGATNSLWASMIYDMLFTTCKAKGDYHQAMGVVSNVCSTLSASGRYGRLAEVMAVWEQGHRMAGNRMDISSYTDLGPAIPCLPGIRHRDMPITQPSQRPIPAGSNARGFHVNDAGAFTDYASLRYSAGNWQESLEYTIWIRDWATNQKTQQPIGEFATAWYAATSTVISTLKYMGFQDEALALVEEGLAAPHGQTYHGRWKIFLAADHLHSLMLLDRAPSDIIEQYAELVGKAKINGHINRGGVFSIQNQMAQALVKSGLIQEGEALFDQLVSEGSGTARRSRLTHWIKSGRVDGVEDELKNLLKSSRETGQKMSEYGLYRDYAAFLEKTGRQREALLMRREVIRLAKSFGLFTHLPLEQSKLAILLMKLGDKSGSDELAKTVRSQLNGGKLPKSIAAEISANLAKLDSLIGNSVAEKQEDGAIDLQPQRSMVIPIADLPWTTYLTLTNPGKQAREGKLIIEGPSVEYSVNEETGDITITPMESKAEPATKEFACSVDPGTYRLVHLSAGADKKIEGEIRIAWQDADSSSNASVVLEAPEAGVSGAIIQAGEYRANPFYGVPMFLQYVGKVDAPDSPPLRFVCSHASRVEVYQLDGTPLAIDAQGNGTLLNQGDELFVKSDGKGNMILPLSNGSAAMNLILYPEEGIPEEGLNVDVEVYTDGEWQLHSRNRLAK
jgi:tetratricopeptide (TPR) repeat protein